jgi:uncharacterized protein YcgI (DUF1989 family)
LRIEIAPGHGQAVTVPAGQALTVTDVDGGQVGDLFAFVAGDPTEYLSASHTRAVLGRMFPRPGEAFMSTRREPLLILEADDSPGVHDMLVAACDPKRYHLLGAVDHRSCAANLAEAYPESAAVPVPQPVNVFMAVEVAPDGTIRLGESPTAAGDSITLRAVRDCTVVVSVCPQDLIPINRGGVTRLALELRS